MKIGVYTDSLASMSFADMLEWCAANGIAGVEIGTGNFSIAPHCDLNELLKSSRARIAFQVAIAQRGLELVGFNCSGNVLDGNLERRQKSQQVFFDSLRLAGLLGLKTLVAMSGCPGEPGDKAQFPNWVTSYWQAEYQDLVAWQWQEVVLPFWQRAAGFARDHGVRLAIEMHPGQSVYNPYTLQQLISISGSVVGANLDPSHLFWQGIEPLRVIEALGTSIYHVHIKDCWIDVDEFALNGGLDNRLSKLRAWEHCPPGTGHGEHYWGQFIRSLAKSGYAGSLCIEYAGSSDQVESGLRESVALLERGIRSAGQ